MKLYHGTCGGWVPDILKKGLRPRGARGGNWADQAPSHPDYVYLTNVYAGYFALCAAGEERIGAVFEIDTDALFDADFAPDEDFLAQVAKAQGQYPDETLLEVTAHYREHLSDWLGGPLWEASLNGLGTCAHYGTIPPRAITRYVTFDLRKNPHLAFIIDPTITLMNYKLLAGRYRMYTARLFGDEIVAPQGDFMCGPADVVGAHFDRNDFNVVVRKKKKKKVAA